MAKILISDLAKEVAKKHKLPQKETEQFIANMFAVVAEGLQQDKLVKVKGLGTFKVTQVKPRESVDVNTGERVLISGHDKVTFTPDSLMKELVNKPFAQFETVVINGDVDFAAVAEKAEKITPVPGGVGGVTTSILARHVVLAAKRRFY